MCMLNYGLSLAPPLKTGLGSLQDHALLLLLLPCEKCGAGRMLEHLADALVRLGGTFEVLDGADLLTDVLGLFITWISFP